MFISYDADAVYVKLRSDVEHSADTREIDMWRYADYDDQGELIGVEFLRASHGIHLSGIPAAEAVAEAIRALPRVASFVIYPAA